MKGKLGTFAPYLATLAVLLCTSWLIRPIPDPPRLLGAGTSNDGTHPQVALLFQAEDCDETAAAIARLESAARENGLSFRAYLIDSPERLPEVRERLARRDLRTGIASAGRGAVGLLRQLGHVRSPVVVVTDPTGSVRQIHPFPIDPAGVERLLQSLDEPFF